MPFHHPCFPVLIVFGSFILHDDGGGVCCCADTFPSSSVQLKRVRQSKEIGGKDEVEMGGNVRKC